MPLNKDTPRQIRIETSLLRIIREIQEQTEYSTSAFVSQAIKEYIKNSPETDIDPRLELGVKFYEKKEKIFCFRISHQMFEELVSYSQKRNMPYTKVIYQALIYFLIRLKGKE